MFDNEVKFIFQILVIWSAGFHLARSLLQLCEKQTYLPNPLISWSIFIMKTIEKFVLFTFLIFALPHDWSTNGQGNSIKF